MSEADSQHLLRSFSAKEAVRYSGVSAPMVNYLCRIKLVEPKCSCKRGHGKARHYSFGDIVSLRMVDRLCKVGVKVYAIRMALSRLQALNPKITLGSLPANQFIFDGEHLFHHDGTAVLERIFDGQVAFAFVIELARARDEVIGLMPEKVVEEMRGWGQGA